MRLNGIVELPLTLGQYMYIHSVFCPPIFNDRDARVMWDQKSGRSRGFGFVSYRSQAVSEFNSLVSFFRKPNIST